MTFSDEDMNRRMPRRTWVLLLLSAISTISIILAPAGFPSLVCAGISIFLWRRGSFATSRRLTTIGWGCYLAITVLQIVVTLFDLGTP